nr:MAG TPA: hypothetical protein [Caudoviricetes sp.]
MLNVFFLNSLSKIKLVSFLKLNSFFIIPFYPF